MITCQERMKTPDKIYVHVRTEPRPSITFSEAVEKNSTNEEYIRKDTLLELLKQKRTAVIDCSAADKRKVAALSVIDFLIDKIELL